MTNITNEELARALKILATEIVVLQKKLEGFEPVTVDLRIDGIVRPVTLFALDANPQLNPTPFQIVK